jgi:hypothetical protein
MYISARGNKQRKFSKRISDAYITLNAQRCCVHDFRFLDDSSTYDWFQPNSLGLPGMEQDNFGSIQKGSCSSYLFSNVFNHIVN